MLQVKRNRLKLSAREYNYLKHLSRGVKDLYNVAIYNNRQRFFKNEQYCNYYDNNQELKPHQAYCKIPAVLSQQTLMSVDEAFRSFFALLKQKKEDEHVGLPKYLDKDGFYVLQFPVRKGRMLEHFSIRLDKQSQLKYKMKFVKIKRPDCLKNKILKEVKIVPKCKAKYFEINWIYEEETNNVKVDNDKIIAIDLGVNNFATIVDNISGLPIILDGKKIKSCNRYFNKKTSNKKPNSMNKARLFYKRSRILDNDINQYVNFVLQYCIQNKIGSIVVGQGYMAQNGCNIGKKNNQNFVNIPFGKFINKLKNKCLLNGISFDLQEESYTSKCDHLAGEEMKHQKHYLGKRIKRGLFQSSTGTLLNADVNGALGIMLKSKHDIDINQLVSSGCLTQPRRIYLDDIQRYSSKRLVCKHTDQASRLA